jgi:hypothetical protein
MYKERVETSISKDIYKKTRAEYDLPKAPDSAITEQALKLFKGNREEQARMESMLAESHKAAKKEKERQSQEWISAKRDAMLARKELMVLGVTPKPKEYEDMSTEELRQLTALYTKVGQQVKHKIKKRSKHNVVLSPEEYDTLNPLTKNGYKLEHIERGEEPTPDAQAPTQTAAPNANPQKRSLSSIFRNIFFRKKKGAH